jgi:hypothetical protein
MKRARLRSAEQVPRPVVAAEAAGLEEAGKADLAAGLAEGSWR